MPSEQSSPPRVPVCLVLMPMLAGYESIRAVVARVLARAGVRMCRLEEAVEDVEWQLWLAESVSRADLALADVTDNNPFVMYELGMAHQRGLPTTLIVDSSNARVPATVLGSPFIPYAADDYSTFEDTLANVVREVAHADEPVASRAEANDLPACYEQALRLLSEFRAGTSVLVEPVSRREFHMRLGVANARKDRMPDSQSSQRLTRYLLARIISNSDEPRVMGAAEAWIASRP